MSRETSTTHQSKLISTDPSASRTGLKDDEEEENPPQLARHKQRDIAKQEHHRAHFDTIYINRTKQYHTRLGDVFPEDLGLHCLGISEVHRLVQQLVDDDEVITDGLLLQLAEVVFEYVNLG